MEFPPFPALPQYCHPDRNADGHELCVLLNEAYETLTDSERRAAYDAELYQNLLDEDDGFTGEALSKW